MFDLEKKEERITKELIMQHVSQEQIFEHYLGIPVKKGLFVSPTVIRKDSKPTASFYKNKKGSVIYKDFAGPSFDCYGAVEYIFQCSFYKALKIIANDFNIVKFENYEYHPPKIAYSGVKLETTDRANIQVEIKEFSKKELEWWENFGVSLKTLQKFKIFSIKNVFLNGNYHTSSSETTPIYGYYGGEDKDGDEYWRLYFPTKRNYRFISNWKATMLQGIKQLPKSGENIVITKSLKDVASLFEFGVTAIAPCSENLFLTPAQYAKLEKKFKNIFILYDRDLPGVKAARKIRKQFPNLKVLLIPAEFKCKDFTDFVKKYGTLKTCNFVEKWQKNLSDQIPL